MKKFLLAILVALAGIWSLSSSQRWWKPEELETLPDEFDADELLVLLRSYTPGDGYPAFFQKVLPLGELEKMTGARIKALEYWREAKPSLFQVSYYLTGKRDYHMAIGITIVNPSSPFTREDLINQGKQHVSDVQNSSNPLSTITLIPLGDSGYLEVYQRPPSPPPTVLTPEFRKVLQETLGIPPEKHEEYLKSLHQEYPRKVDDFEGRVEVSFIKGRVMVGVRSHNYLLEPEEAIEIARRFEAIIK